MTEQKQYWKVTDGENYCAWETFFEAKDFLELEMEYQLDILEHGEDSPKLYIEECFMTEEEFNNLPEFEGF